MFLEVRHAIGPPGPVGLQYHFGITGRAELVAFRGEFLAELADQFNLHLFTFDGALAPLTQPRDGETAVDAVQRAHIPPFPDHWKIEKLHLHAQFNYELVTD